MRRVVTGGDLAPRDMRPPGLLEEYLALVEEDVQALGLTQAHHARACPACGGHGDEAFARMGFAYRRCGACTTLFVSPVPEASLLRRYRHESRAERFWRDSLLTATAEVRARHALGPRVQWVAGTAAARLGTGLTLGELGRRNPLTPQLFTAHPTFAQHVDFELDGSAPALSGGVDVLVAFEALERADDLGLTLHACRRWVKPEGLLFVSTLSGSGLEVRLLGGRMRSLVPPIHLQLLSRTGWAIALEAAGFRLLEYSTPGELDVRAVADACRQDVTLPLPPIVEDLVRHEDVEVLQAFQEVLQQAGLSAHVQFVALALSGAGGEGRS